MGILCHHDSTVRQNIRFLFFLGRVVSPQTVTTCLYIEVIGLETVPCCPLSLVFLADHPHPPRAPRGRAKLRSWESEIFSRWTSLFEDCQEHEKITDESFDSQRFNDETKQTESSRKFMEYDEKPSSQSESDILLQSSYTPSVSVKVAN